MSCQTSKLKLTKSWSQHVFWLNTLSKQEKNTSSRQIKMLYLRSWRWYLKNGLKNPIILVISKKTEPIYIYIYIYIYEGNHCMTAFLDNNVDWVSLMVSYFFLNDDDDTRLRPLQWTVNGNLLSNPKPSNFGFETRPI